MNISVLQRNGRDSNKRTAVIGNSTGTSSARKWSTGIANIYVVVLVVLMV